MSIIVSEICEYTAGFTPDSYNVTTIIFEIHVSFSSFESCWYLDPIKGDIC